MKYTVIWEPTAEYRLAELWLAAANRNAIRDAADEIDRVLSRDPLNAGESRVSNLRILIEAPLAVLYDVKPADLKVKVWSVWRPVSIPPNVP